MSETKTTEDERNKAEKPPPGESADPVADEPPHSKPNGVAVKAKASEPPPKEEDEKPGDILLTKGNPLRYRRGIGTILGGGIPAFLLMAKNGQNGWSIPVGFLFLIICAFGVMDLLGTFDDAEEPKTTTTLGELIPSLGAFFALSIGFGGALILAQSARISSVVAAVLVPATFLALVASIFELGKRLGPWKTDEAGNERPLIERHGFWVIAIGALLYLPAMGSFSLWDPWETHYGEVAREILARDDWVSLWWAQDGWFWSKPILNFWIQSIAMGALDTHYAADQMLMGSGGLANAHPEWIVRTPNVLMTITAMYLLYKGVAKVFGRRAGLLGAVVLATMPDWFFLAHQTMTDMPFVAAMTAAMGLLLYGLNTEEEATVKTYGVTMNTGLLGTLAFALGALLIVLAFVPGGGAKLVLLPIAAGFVVAGVLGRRANKEIEIKLSLWHAVFGAVLLCALPQIIYLLSRNIELQIFGDGPHGFRVHWDEFKSGSPGNCGIPGNENCTPHSPAALPKTDTWWSGSKAGGITGYFRLIGAFEPAAQAIVWGGVIGGILYLNWGERRARRLVYISAWLCAAIATMAKGPAGFGLPIICAIAYVATKRRWSEILRFELITGLLVILAVALPWYVAMYVRHGSPFTDRLIFHDMFNRAFSHVHDTNEGDDTGIRYYLWQLGYATFPWSGLVPLGLLWGFRRSDSALARKGAAVGDASVMLVMWFLFAFALFTFMGTKFHHYIFPAVPPAAMLVGVVLDDMLGRITMPAKQLATYLAALAGATALAVFGASKLWVGSVLGAKADAGATANPMVAGVLLAIGLALFAVIVLRFKSEDDDEPSESETENQRRTHEQLMLGAAAFSAALVTVLVGRDLAMKPEGAEMTGAIRLLQLFTYNYRRPWPDTLDFSAVLGAFTAIAALIGLALSIKTIRKHAVAAVCMFGLLWAVWGLDVYMFELSPHWGQHEVIEAYYRDRKGPDEPLVAYQMNWKGENFYTSNRIPAFVSSGATFATYLKKEREKGTKVMYFITEHSRTSGLRSEVAGKGYKDITDKALNNKFIVVRAEL